MFSYPNKERRAAWIRQVVAAGRHSAEENGGIELPIYTLHEASSGLTRNTKAETHIACGTNGSCGGESSLDTLSWNSKNNPCDPNEDAGECQGQNSSSQTKQNMPGIPSLEESGDQSISKSLERDFRDTVKPGIALGGIVLGGVGEELEENISDSSSDEGPENPPDIIETETVNTSNMPVYSEVANEKPSMYLKQYYDMIYYCGIIAYTIGRKRQVEGCSSRELAIPIQKFAFWILSTLSIFDSFCRVKSNFMLAVSSDSEAEYSTLVYIAFHLAALVAKLYIFILFLFNKKKTDKMFQSMENYESIYHVRRMSSRASWKIKMASALALSTLTMTVSKQCLVASKLCAKTMILQLSREQAKDLVIWNPDTMTNNTDLLENEMGENITNSKIALGVIFLIRTSASDLQVGMIFDLVIVVCIVMNMFSSKFIEEIKAITENVPKENLEEWKKLQAKRELAWKKYRMLKLIAADVNNIFDPLFKLLHICNLLSYAFFMAHVFFRNSSLIFFLFFAVNLVKAEIGYYIAGNIAQVNDAIRTWIFNWAEETGKFVVDGKEIDAGIQLERLSVEPIGLGKGIFLIHQTFHYKFMGVVGSVFFSMADEENKA